MHDPLRERDPSGRANARRVARSTLHRTTGLGDERTNALQPAETTPHPAVGVRLHSPTKVPQMGHNGGPLLQPNDPDEGWRRYCWRRAHKAAWKTPPREIALRRLERAEVLGMTYRDYTLEILERGRYL